jgi:hypothetical protein
MSATGPTVSGDPLAVKSPVSELMARESKTLASDVVPLLDGLTVADLDQVIAAAQQQREA